MRTYVLILIGMFAASLFGQRMDSAELADQIEARRIAHLTKALNLTSEEAQEFWPVFNSFREDQKNLRNKMQTDNLSGMNDEQKLDMLISIEQQQLELKKDYARKFKQIIGSGRTIKLFQEGRSFNEKMIKGLRDRRKMRAAKEKGF